MDSTLEGTWTSSQVPEASEGHKDPTEVFGSWYIASNNVVENYLVSSRREADYCEARKELLRLALEHSGVLLLLMDEGRGMDENQRRLALCYLNSMHEDRCFLDQCYTAGWK